MKLKTWMKENDMNVISLAIKLNMDRSTIYKYMDGSRRPSLKVSIKIETLTKGAVTCSDLVKNVNS